LIATPTRLLDGAPPGGAPRPRARPRLRNGRQGQETRRTQTDTHAHTHKPITRTDTSEPEEATVIPATLSKPEHSASEYGQALSGAPWEKRIDTSRDLGDGIDPEIASRTVPRVTSAPATPPEGHVQTAAVVTTSANSSWRLMPVMRAISAAGTTSPSGAAMSNVGSRRGRTTRRAQGRSRCERSSHSKSSSESRTPRSRRSRARAAMRRDRYLRETTSALF
jgi:hypothetical protein